MFHVWRIYLNLILYFFDQWQNILSNVLTLQIIDGVTILTTSPPPSRLPCPWKLMLLKWYNTNCAVIADYSICYKAIKAIESASSPFTQLVKGSIAVAPSVSLNLTFRVSLGFFIYCFKLPVRDSTKSLLTFNNSKWQDWPSRIVCFGVNYALTSQM